MNKHLSKDGHVWSKFGSGNRESLSKAGKDLKAKGKLNGNGSPKVNGVTPSPMTSLRPSPIPSRGASPAPSVTSTSSELDADGGTVGRETRRRLVEWWSKEYCSSRMNLCVIGKGKYVDFLARLLSLTAKNQNLWGIWLIWYPVSSHQYKIADKIPSQRLMIIHLDPTRPTYAFVISNISLVMSVFYLFK